MRLSAALAALALTACAQNTWVHPDLRDGAPSERTAEETAGMLAFVNDYAVSTRDVLDFDCALYSDTAMHIDKYRSGKDKTYGTSDDRTIDDEAELDGIHQVGPASIDALYDCAEVFGYIDGCDQPGWTIEYVYDDETEAWRDELPFELVDVIDDVSGYDQWCGSAYGDAWFVKATVDRLDCVEMGYTIELRQLVDEFHGLTWYIEFEVDTEFSYDPPVCEI